MPILVIEDGSHVARYHVDVSLGEVHAVVDLFSQVCLVSNPVVVNRYLLGPGALEEEVLDHQAHGRVEEARVEEAKDVVEESLQLDVWVLDGIHESR